MGGCDVVMEEEGLWNFGPITMNFKEIYIRFIKEGHKHHLKGIHASSSNSTISHYMEKLLKKFHSCTIAQFNAIQATGTTPQDVDLEFKIVIFKHQ